MAYTWSGQRITAPITISSNQPEFVTETANLKRLVTSQDAQRWELMFGLEPTTDAGGLFVAMTSAAQGVRTMVVPQIYKSGSVNECATTATVDAIAAAGASSVTVSLGTGDIGKVIYKGTFIKFAGHTKVYMVTADATAVDNTTEALATLSVYPELRAGVVVSEVVSYLDDVDLSYWLGEQLRGISYADGIVASVGSVAVLEAI
jgi:hypothetical protein